MSDTTALSPQELPGSGARCAVHPDRQARVTCARCGNYACEACETKSDGGEAICKACEAIGDLGGVIPWEQRNEIGIPRAFVQTVLGVTTKPWELFAARSKERSLLPVIVFALLVQLPVSLLGMVTNGFTMEAQRAEMLANPVVRPYIDQIGWLFGWQFQVATILVSFIAYPLILLLYSVGWHVPLMLFGAAKRPFRETVRALGYVHATYLPYMAVLPIIAVTAWLGASQIGGLLGLPFVIYVYAVAGIAMWKTHRCDGWRVFAAVGAQWALLFVFSCGLGMLMAFVIFQNMPIPVR